MQTFNISDKQHDPSNAFCHFNNLKDDTFNQEKQLVEKLQSTLNITELLSYFSLVAADFIDFSGLYFQKSNLKIAMPNSQPAKNERKYDIKINGEYIGSLNYAINTPLSMKNNKILQQLHKYLAYPLRNATLYHQAIQLAMEDSLTHIGNRRLFDDSLKRAMSKANRYQTHVGLILLDLDKFKLINDNFGHQIGDKILIQFANAITNSIRDSDLAFRFGGDEFAILVEQADVHSLRAIKHRLHDAISSNLVLTQYQVACSLGATLMTRADTEHSLFERADQILYRNKNNEPTELKLVTS